MKKLAKLLVFLLLAGVLSGCTEVVEEKEIEIRAYDEEEYAGIDFKLECLTCQRQIIISRLDVKKRIKKIVEEK